MTAEELDEALCGPRSATQRYALYAGFHPSLIPIDVRVIWWTRAGFVMKHVSEANALVDQVRAAAEVSAARKAERKQAQRAAKR